MKSGSDSAAVGRALEQDEFVSRKLIRPTLRKTASGEIAEGPQAEPRERAPRHLSVRGNTKQAHATQEQTHAEDFYYQKQMASKTLMTVVLKSGDVVQGVIEWYDRNSIKLNRVGKPNLLIYKPSIRYMHKSDESR